MKKMDKIELTDREKELIDELRKTQIEKKKLEELPVFAKYNELLEKENDIKERLQNIFKANINELGIYNGYSVYWKPIKRMIGKNANIERLKEINPEFIRTIEKPKTLKTIDRIIKAYHHSHDEIYKLLDLQQIKSLIVEKIK